MGAELARMSSSAQVTMSVSVGEVAEDEQMAYATFAALGETQELKPYAVDDLTYSATASPAVVLTRTAGAVACVTARRAVVVSSSACRLGARSRHEEQQSCDR